MRVALVATPVWAMQTPPLTTAYLAGWLKRHGHPVLQLDWNIELFRDAPAQLKDRWDRTHLHLWQDEEAYRREIAPDITGPSLDVTARRILAFDPQLIGLSVYSTRATLDLAAKLRELAPDVPLIAGGQICDPGVYGYPLAWSGLFEVVVYGEGEGPLLDVMAALDDREPDYRSIPGLLIPGPRRQVHDTGPREPVADIDSLAHPDFEGLPMEAYTQAVEPPFDPSRMVSTLLSRGCVCRCDFCLQAEIWRTFRWRDPADVVDEMVANRDRYGLVRYHFNDLLINGSVRQLEGLCDRLIAVGWDLPWAGNATVTRTLTRPLLDKLKRAGCDKLGFGFESFDDTVLEAMNKPYRAADVARLLADLQAVEMDFFSNLIIGHPAEGRRKFASTVRFLIEHHGRFTEPPTSSLLIIQRNTPLHRERARWGVEMEDGDALGWRLRDGTNDLPERKRRAQVMDFFYDAFFGTRIKITDMDLDRDLTVSEDD